MIILFVVRVQSVGIHDVPLLKERFVFWTGTDVSSVV
jgi:hypothetical protein